MLKYKNVEIYKMDFKGDMVKMTRESRFLYRVQKKA